MKTIGFLISHKKNEKRIALLPEHVKEIKHSAELYFEKGYGEDIGYTDDDYILAGANIESRDKIMKRDVICEPKIGDGDYLNDLDSGKTIFGWIHAVQNREVTDILLNKNMTAIAWEDMDDDGRHVFWKNNEIAGEAAILHAFTLFGKLPTECKVALIGRGNVARGSYKILTSLGADVTVYDKRSEKVLCKECNEYDVIVNAVLWDTDRDDHIIYRKDLKRMKKPSMIIDVSCDREGAIETSRPTTIEDPVYKVDGVLHYAVDHTPSILYISASKAIGDNLAEYIDDIVADKVSENEILKRATIIKDGMILDRRIITFQNRE